MQDVLQVLANGLVIGCVYALIAIGFTMTLRATELVNFAQGEMVMLGAFLGFTIASLLPIPFFMVFVVVTLLMAVVGLVMDRVVFRPILAARAPLLNLIISTVGISIALKALAVVIWGGYPLRLPGISMTELVYLGPIAMDPASLWVLGLALVVMVGLQWFLERTLTGIAWRATAFDQETAQLMGISVTRTVALTFAIASALGGAAGVLLAPIYNITVGIGGIAMKSFAGAALGGFSIVGTMLGGAFLGILETVATGYISSAYKDVVAYGLMIILLLFFYGAKVPVGRTTEERSRTIHKVTIPHLGEVLARYRVPLLVLGVVVWLAAPRIINDAYALRLIDQSLILMIGALGLQIIIGYTGQFSFSHAAFMGIGAFTSVILTKQVGVPWVITLLAALALPGLVAWVVSPVLRLPGHYLALATLALGQIVLMLMINLDSITNGAYGISNIPSPRLGPLVADDNGSYFYVVSAVVVGLYFCLARMLHSRFGRALLAVRENELGAVASGVDLLGYRSKAFVLGSACAGLAGALYAPFLSIIHPLQFTLELTIDFLIMVVIGGLGSLPGAALGAVVVTLAPEYLRFLGAWRLVIYGGTLILFMVLLPGGLMDLLRRPLLALVTWPPLLRLLERLASTPSSSHPPAPASVSGPAKGSGREL